MESDGQFEFPKKWVYYGNDEEREMAYYYLKLWRYFTIKGLTYNNQFLFVEEQWINTPEWKNEMGTQTATLALKLKMKRNE